MTVTNLSIGAPTPMEWLNRRWVKTPACKHKALDTVVHRSTRARASQVILPASTPQPLVLDIGTSLPATKVSPLAQPPSSLSMSHLFMRH
ncbi:hypothetical protein GUJ93_ZPchr0012g21162 [Zizania palustris]|uniref:Uncharacterized protein n=1 Tax=Zizania palustris TaxID=103762 RepID=A0A8J5WT69_ZIZPA|nr:hypothetical protein GUJ93_ZPchr0012g21162 [Zizania palustris]